MTYPVTSASKQSMLSRSTENQELGHLIQEWLENLEKDIKTHDTKVKPKETGFKPSVYLPNCKRRKKTWKYN